MTSELKVGMLFLVVVALILTFTVFITPSLRQRGAYSVTFPRVQRLKAGDPVTYNGVRVGSVSAVEPVLQANGMAAVSVIFSIEAIRKRAVLVDEQTKYLIRQGILGGAELEIQSSTGMPITPEGTKVATGAEPVGVDEAVASVHKLVDENRVEIQKAIVALREGMQAFGEMSTEVRDAVKENRDQLKATIRNIGTAAGSIDGTVTENRENIRAAILNVRTVAERIGEVVADNREQIRIVLETFTRAGGKVAGAAGQIEEAVAENRPNLKKTIDHAGVISEQIASGQGTVGKLVFEDTLHTKAETMLDNANQRLEEVKPLTQGFSELKFIGGLSAGNNLDSGVTIGEAYMRLEPRPWKFYEVGVVYRTAGDNRDIQNDDPDKLNVDFNLQVGYRWFRDDEQQFYRLGASAGLLESRAGGRLWWNFTKNLALNTQIRQKHNTRELNDRRYETGDVRLRATLDYTIWERVSFSVGADDLAYKPGVWFGLRGELQDNDLKYLFLAATLAR
jgi:phospholipid/cholesterol/gamma-HCH transport system substrate-binding protein